MRFWKHSPRKAICRKGQLCKSGQTRTVQCAGTFSSEVSTYPRHAYFLYPRKLKARTQKFPQSLRTARPLPARSPGPGVTVCQLTINNTEGLVRRRRLHTPGQQRPSSSLPQEGAESQAPPRVGPHPPALTPTWPPPLSLLVSLTLLKETGAFIQCAPRSWGSRGGCRRSWAPAAPAYSPACSPFTWQRWLSAATVQQEGVHGVGVRPDAFTFSTGNILLKRKGRSWRTPMGS